MSIAGTEVGKGLSSFRAARKYAKDRLSTSGIETSWRWVGSKGEKLSVPGTPKWTCDFSGMNDAQRSAESGYLAHNNKL